MAATGELIRLINYVDDITTSLRRIQASLPGVDAEEKKRLAENLRLNLGTASAQAVVTSARGDVIEVDLKKPVSIEAGMRAVADQQPARGHDPRRLGQHGREVVDVGRDPHCGHGRERAVGEGQGGRVSPHDVPGPASGDA